jgi:HNH endonuclease
VTRPALFLVAPEDRFWSLVLVVENCWEWLGSDNGRGYGKFVVGRKHALAHRWAYEHFKGPIPAGLTIDHLCRNRRCVNPDHMEVVTMRTNLMRGDAPSAINARKTHCRHGHELAPENVYLSSNGRACRACVLAGQRRRYYADLEHSRERNRLSSRRYQAKKRAVRQGETAA